MSTLWNHQLAGIALLAFALLGLGVLYVTAWTPEARTLADPPVPDDATEHTEVEAPNFERPTMAGDTFRLSDQRGTIVVLNFWATWCGPCREEIPDFIKLQEEFADDVQFVGISLDQGGFDAVRAYAEEMGINYPIVMDDGAIARKFGGIPALPTTFVVGRDGIIKGYAPGMLTEDMLRPELETLIANHE